MGKGEIVSGGSAGQYDVKIIYGQGNIEKQKENLNTLIQKCDEELAPINDQLAALEGEITTLRNSMIDLNAEVADLMLEQKQLFADKRSLTSEIDELEDQIKDLAEEISRLESNIAILEAIKSSIQSDIDSIDAEITALEDNPTYFDQLLALQQLETIRSQLAQSITQLQNLIIANQSAISEKKLTIELKQSDIAEKEYEIELNISNTTDKQSEITAKQAELIAKQEEIIQNPIEIAAKQSEIAAKQAELTPKQAEVAAKQAEITAKQDEIVIKQSEIDALKSEKIIIEDQQLALEDQESSLTTEMNNAKEASSALENQMDSLTAVYATHEQTIIELQARITDLESFISTMQAALDNAEENGLTEEEISDLQAAIASAQEELSLISGQIELLTSEMIDISSEITNAKELLDILYDVNASNEAKTLLALAAELQTEINELIASEASQEDINVLQSYLDTTNTQIDEMKSDDSFWMQKSLLSALQLEIDAKQLEIDEKQSEIDEKQSELTSLQSQADTLQSELNSLQSEADALESELNNLQKELDEIPTIDQLQSQETILKDALSVLQDEKTNLEAQLLILQSEKDSIEADIVAIEELIGIIELENSNYKIDLDTLNDQKEAIEEEINNYELINYEYQISLLNTQKSILETARDNTQNNIDNINAIKSVDDGLLDYKNEQRDNKELELNSVNSDINTNAGLIESKKAKIETDNSLLDQKNKDFWGQDVKRKVLEIHKFSYQKRLDQLLAVPKDKTISAWCADFTETLAGEVALIEIPGESRYFNIYPGYNSEEARYNQARDGQLVPILAQTAAQVFYNLAMLPGWQKWRPTYRYGTITAIDVDNDTANVTLDNTLSAQLNININQASSLENVPVVYMECNAEAFEVGDIVLVKFLNQQFQTPVIIGFRDHPKPCGIVSLKITVRDNGTSALLPGVAVDITFTNVDGTYSGTTNDEGFISTRRQNFSSEAVVILSRDGYDSLSDTFSLLEDTALEYLLVSSGGSGTTGSWPADALVEELDLYTIEGLYFLEPNDADACQETYPPPWSIGHFTNRDYTDSYYLMKSCVENAQFRIKYGMEYTSPHTFHWGLEWRADWNLFPKTYNLPYYHEISFELAPSGYRSLSMDLKCQGTDFPSRVYTDTYREKWLTSEANIYDLLVTETHTALSEERLSNIAGRVSAAPGFVWRICITSKYEQFWTTRTEYSEYVPEWTSVEPIYKTVTTTGTGEESHGYKWYSWTDSLDGESSLTGNFYSRVQEYKATGYNSRYAPDWQLISDTIESNYSLLEFDMEFLYATRAWIEYPQEGEPIVHQAMIGAYGRRYSIYVDQPENGFIFIPLMTAPEGTPYGCLGGAAGIFAYSGMFEDAEY